mmetsp:Transcript_59551/g.130697  ORF Transcript_59551/g.130697 Transcript_59551/m.130697 type:complete len:270 (-) Transcript_59551:545-1354(-)
MMPHQVHHSRSPASNDPEMSQVLELEARVLKPDSVPEEIVCQGLLAHYLHEDIPVQGPDLRLIAGDLHSGGSGLVEEDRTFTEVGIPPIATNHCPVNDDLDLALRDHEEVRAPLPLQDDLVALSVKSPLGTTYKLLELTSREMPEDADLRHDIRHFGGFLVGAAPLSPAARCGAPRRHRRGEHCQSAPPVASDEDRSVGCWCLHLRRAVPYKRTPVPVPAPQDLGGWPATDLYASIEHHEEQARRLRDFGAGGVFPQLHCLHSRKHLGR